MTDYAHIKPLDDGWKTQSIPSHAHGVAIMAEAMAKAFGAGEWARLCGQWHDIGKYSSEFQRHIISASGFDPTVSDPGTVDHATAGALYAKERLQQMSLPVAYCICGHHSGLMDFEGSGRANLRFHLSKQEQHLLEDVRLCLPPAETLSPLSAPQFDKEQSHPRAWHLWIRMLFSCLVDADWLDTERFMKPDHYHSRSQFASLPQLYNQLELHLKRLAVQAPSTPVNAVRAEVQQACRNHGDDALGIYSLTVPTGGGKTLSSLLWAMEHAMRHQLRRIIIAIPYTSIVTQTADRLRDIFGTENVVEHHSYFDFDSLPESERLQMSLATENWDAPIIVTTNVQLFESLFSNKPSRCRKLHNLARSVLILDEVQMLPAENLHPLIDILDGLSKYMQTSILLTTATQPAFSGTIGTGQAAFAGLQCKEIISDVNALYQRMRRTEVTFLQRPFSCDGLATRLAEYEQVLCVVNTRREAQQLFRALPSGGHAFHLSRMMCQQHIADKLVAITRRLDGGEPVTVVSTQLIEAGVDIDFPVVWREMAGLDSIAQAAGRCNREGRSPKGQVFVFSIEGARLRGVMRKSADASADLMESGVTDFLSPAAASDYFRQFYAKLNDTDKADVAGLLYKPCPQFAEAAKAFRMISDDGLSLYVPYAKGEELLEQWKAGQYSSTLLRKLQRYCISLPQSMRDSLEAIGALRLGDDVYALPDRSHYDDSVGLVMENEWLEKELII